MFQRKDSYRFLLYFSSEPPDLGNWFSSYAYESPALNPSQEFGSCESEKTGLGHEIEETLENVRKTENGGGVKLNLFVKCNGNSRDNRQDNQPLREVQVPSSFSIGYINMKYLQRALDEK